MPFQDMDLHIFKKIIFFSLRVYIFLQAETVASNVQIKEFDIHEHITKLTRDTSGNIYLGGVNFIAKFAPELNDSLSKISLGPVTDKDNCTPQPAPCNNTVKVMEVVEQLEMLLVCGTAYNGTCTLHSLDNMSDRYCLESVAGAGILASVNNMASIMEIPLSESGNTESPSAATVNMESCRYHDFGTIKPDTLSSQTDVSSRSNEKHKNTKTGEGVHWVKLIVAGYNLQKLPVISIQGITRVNNTFIAKHVDNSLTKLKENCLAIESIFPNKFVYSFHWNNCTYFLSIQHVDVNNKTKITKLGRVAVTYHTAIRYVETQLKCLGADNGTVMTAATFTNVNVTSSNNSVPILLVAFGSNFGTDTTGSAEGGVLCVFFMEKVNNVLQAGIEECLGGSDQRVKPVDWVDEESNKCQETQSTKSIYVQLNSEEKTQTALLRRNYSISALYTSQSNPSDVMDLFMITDDGSLEKILIFVENQKVKVKLAETFRLSNYTKGVNLFADTNVYARDVYVTLGSKLIRRRVHRCQQFKVDGECVSETCRWCQSTRQCEDKTSVCQTENLNTIDMPRATKICSFFPLFGPVSGGTLLTFQCQNLSAIENATVTVGASNCDVKIDSTSLTCRVGRKENSSDNCVQVQMRINGLSMHISETSFCFKPNPVFNPVNKRSVFSNEEMNITILGSNFDSITSSHIVIVYIDPATNESYNFRGVCLTINSAEKMTCVIPTDLYNITEELFQFNRSISYVDFELGIEMDNTSVNFTATSRTIKLRIHRFPNIGNDTVQQRELSETDPILVLSVRGLDGFDIEDITATVGDQKCHILSLKTNQLECNFSVGLSNLKNESKIAGNTRSDGCARSPQSGEHNVKCNVKLQIGQYVTELGHVTISLAPSEVMSEAYQINFVVGISLAGIVTIALFILSVTLLTHLKRSESKKSQVVDGPSLNVISSGVGEVAMPTLQQILASVDSDKSRQDEMSKMIYSIDKLTIGKCIGSGNFGTVFDGILEISPELPTEKVAIKMLQDPQSHNLDLLGFVQEAVMMRKFQHTNVLGLIGLTEQEPGIPLVIMPFLENGDLLTYVRNQSLSLTLHDVITFGADIANGMAYLSSLKIVHRDLAARNCMLDSDYRVRVADFGLCRDIYEKGYYTSDNKKVLPIRWMARESIENGTYSTKSDVWSFSVVIWELLTRGLTPYPGVDGWDVINYLRQRRLPPPYFCPESLFNLMMMCWANDPNMRPSFKAIQMELLLLIDAGQDGFPTKNGEPELPVSLENPVLKVIESSENTTTQLENRQRETSIEVAETKNEITPGNEHAPPIKEIRSNNDKTKCSDDENCAVVSNVNDRQVMTCGSDSVNQTNDTDNMSIPKPTVVPDVLITIPECYSQADMSSQALGAYVELVANYEPPRTFVSSFLSPSPGCSPTLSGFIDGSQSDAAKEYVCLSEEGAYYKPEEEL